MAKPRKPSKYQSAYEAQYKELQKLVHKAQHKDITLSRSYTPPVPKVIRAQSIAKLERLILQASEIIEEVSKARKTATEDITRSTRSKTAQEDIMKGRFVPEAIRKERARRAAETRRKREEALSPEQREALRRKRAEQFKKNIANRDTQRKPKDNKQKRKRDRDTQRKRNGGDVVSSKGEIIYRKVLKEIEEIATQFLNPYQVPFHVVNSLDLRRLLEDTITQNGFGNVMKRIEEHGDEFNRLCEVIMYSSDQDEIDAAFAFLPYILSGADSTNKQINEMSRQLAEAHENMNAISEEEFEDIPEGALGYDLPEGW